MAMSTALQQPKRRLPTAYKPLEKRIVKGDLDALLARWEFGRMLLEERGEAKRLPNKRVVELLHICNSSSSLGAYRVELHRRTLFAEKYPTAAKAKAAFQKFGTWYAICAVGGPRAVAVKSKENETAQQALAWLKDVTRATREWLPVIRDGRVTFSPEGWQKAADMTEKLAVQFVELGKSMQSHQVREQEILDEHR